MMAERFGPDLLTNRMQLIEPAWKSILSNKGVLPLLWERHEGHPNLLPAHFESGEHKLTEGWVRKPLFSREGANIDLVTPGGEKISSPGPYDDCAAILQAYHPLPSFEGNFPLIGSWVIADEPVGMGMREDDTLITRNTSRFMPHAIID
jgi:glutathionylspermidine synthase